MTALHGWRTRPRDDDVRADGTTADLGRLALRLAVGGLLAGHGAQKLFGWCGGGTLTALGLLRRLGPIATWASMIVAAGDVHGGKPIWAADRGRRAGARTRVIARSVGSRRSAVRRGIAVIVAAFALLGPVAATRSQPATPSAGLPVVPDAAECTAAPRPLADFAALADVPAPATPGSAAIPAGGEPAGPMVVAGIVASLREAFACINGGDFPRFASFYTDAGFRIAFADISADELAVVAATPRALPVTAQLALVDVQDVTLLDDGRVGAVVVVAAPPPDGQGTPVGADGDYLIFVEQDGRYLIDDALDDYTLPAATPTA